MNIGFTSSDDKIIVYILEGYSIKRMMAADRPASGPIIYLILHVL